MKLAVAFTNFGPYHLARLRALGERLARDGGELIAHEVAARERKYPWTIDRGAEPFDWRTLFPDRAVEDIPSAECASAMTAALDRDRPDAVAVAGYVRPESMAALRWAERHGRPAVLMSETQAIDAPRTWWREAAKRARVRRFASALVGGPSHRDYLRTLGMPEDRVALGYNAVDHDGYRRLADDARASGCRRHLPTDRPFFLAVSRLAPEKNLVRLVHAFAPVSGRLRSASRLGFGRLRRRRDGRRTRRPGPAPGPAVGVPPGRVRRSRRSGQVLCVRLRVRPAQPERAVGGWWRTRRRRAGCPCSCPTAAGARACW